MYLNRWPMVLVLLSLSVPAWGQQADSKVDAPYFASGVKVGEVNTDSAIFWVRLTKHPEADLNGLSMLQQGLKPNQRSKATMPTDVVPGAEGQFQIQYRAVDTRKEQDESSGYTLTQWHPVTATNDYIRQVKIDALKPETEYQYKIVSRNLPHATVSNSISGRFRTAPDPNSQRPVRFIVSTCQAVRSIDDRQGHSTYREMVERNPDFFVHTGDILYYDKAPLAKTKDQALAKWHVMFAYPANRNFFRNTSSYFMKDDHDTLKNDCWPGQKYGELTFQNGLDIFRQQVPMGESTFRTYRWGKDLQIWLTENRDFRSPNRMPDGPNKTILGQEQKDWLKSSIENSTATWKFVISPGPIVGPDKKGKNDNHSNKGFQYEGQELRDFLSTQENTFVICGDRHWQYCSQDPKTGLLEFGCGPINDQHKFGGTPGLNKTFHRYFGAKGGFLEIESSPKTATANWWGQKTNDKPFEILHQEILRK